MSSIPPGRRIPPSGISDWLNDRLLTTEHDQVHISAAKWTGKGGNLVLTDGHNNNDNNNNTTLNSSYSTVAASAKLQVTLPL